MFHRTIKSIVGYVVNFRKEKLDFLFDQSDQLNKKCIFFINARIAFVDFQAKLKLRCLLFLVQAWAIKSYY